MEDIVERECRAKTALYDEMVAEIKRLRAAHRATHAGYDADSAAYKAEIERSGKHIEELISALAGMAQALVSSFNEIERLRAALKAIDSGAYSPREDDHIWMDDRTTLGLFISMTLAGTP